MNDLSQLDIEFETEMNLLKTHIHNELQRNAYSKEDLLLVELTQKYDQV